MNSNIVMILAIFTLGAGLLWGILSWLRAKQAKDHHDDAAVAKRQRMDDAAVSSDGTAGFAATGDRDRNWSEERGANPPTPMPPRN